MESILNVVLPVFAIIGAGYLCGRFSLLGPESSEALNRFVYWVALPVLLFRGMATVDMSAVLNANFWAAVVGGQVIVWVLGMGLAMTIFRRGIAEGGMHGMISVYGNNGYMGIPMTLTAYGEAAVLPAIITTMINASICVAVAAALIEIGLNRGGGGTRRVAQDVGRALMKNPLLIAPLLGILWASSGWAMPTPVDTFTRILGAAAGPCALFSIGLFLVGKSVAQGFGEVANMTLLKLLAHPLVTALLAFWVFPMDPLWATTAVLMAALPTGPGAFILAQAHELYVQRTSSVILITTILSVVTLSVFFLFFPPS